MIKQFIIVTLVSVAALVAVPAVAAPLTLPWGGEVNPSQCEPVGNPVINVTQRVINSIDSGEGGNYWAFDDYNRTIQLWQQLDGTYCAVVRYTGNFDAQAGQISPGAGGVLDGDEDGAFQGGYRATITGSLKATPTWPTRGYVGVTDYQCTIAGACPGAVSWIDQYFDPGYAFAYSWWGWIYRAGQHGIWVNSSDGNEGDIL